MSATAARAIPSRSTPAVLEEPAVLDRDRRLPDPERHSVGRHRLAVALGGNRAEQRAVGCVEERVLPDRGRSERAEVTRRAVCKDSSRATESSCGARGPGWPQSRRSRRAAGAGVRWPASDDPAGAASRDRAAFACSEAGSCSDASHAGTTIRESRSRSSDVCTASVVEFPENDQAARRRSVAAPATRRLASRRGGTRRAQLRGPAQRD